MPAPLPSRAAILDLLAKEGRAVHARDLKNALGVDDASFGGFVRLLDNLAFDGLLSAKDESFYRLTVRPGAPVRAGGSTAGRRLRSPGISDRPATAGRPRPPCPGQP